MRNYKRYFEFIVASILALTLISSFMLSCGKVPSKSDNAVAPMMSIYDTIVVASTDPVVGERTDNIYSFDFTEQLPLINGEYDDLFMHYEASILYDNNHWIWDADRETWDQFSSRSSQIVHPMGRDLGHSILGVGLKMQKYINDSSLVRIRSEIFPFMDTLIDEHINVTAVRYHTGYSAIYLSYKGRYMPHSIAFDGKSYWMRTDSNIISQISFDGKVIADHMVYDRAGYGRLTSIEGGFAYSGGVVGLIVIVDKYFNEICTLSLPSGYLGDLAWGNGKLWATNWHEQDSVTLLGIDVDSSCKTGEIVITNSISTDYFFRTLAFDGSHLWSVNALYKPAMLHRIALSGDVVESIAIPVDRFSDMVIYDDVIHILGSGPPGLGCSEQLIARFKLK